MKFMPPPTPSAISQGLLGKDIIVWVHARARRCSATFGFHSKDEKIFFLSLLKVNGVGPKMALSILSGGRPAQIHRDDRSR